MKRQDMTPEQRRDFDACRGKRRHHDEIAARVAAMAALEHPNCTVSRLWVYHCPCCSGWHLTRRNHGPAWKVTREAPVHEATKAPDRADIVTVLRDVWTEITGRRWLGAAQ